MRLAWWLQHQHWHLGAEVVENLTYGVAENGPEVDGWVVDNEMNLCHQNTYASA